MQPCALRNRIGAWHLDLNPSNSIAVRGMLGFASRVEMRRSCDRREGFPLLSLHPRQTSEAGRLTEATGRGTAHALLGSLGFRFQVSGRGPNGRYSLAFAYLNPLHILFPQ